ncbi:hypothetical protein X928_10320 [Petrotoga miotherma DSM 10691]|jgi:hypothetical protein|uniref:Uncharacterized protein n=1 Tax=Petrotoga miotherma DSM 10691 TaxID=1434326 RepID=A0A2K1P3K6_9BACT|nr:hypothetical protein X928_10320 [Petrotoga miotherma DSM 10691]
MGGLRGEVAILFYPYRWGAGQGALKRVFEFVKSSIKNGGMIFGKQRKQF